MEKFNDAELLKLATLSCSALQNTDRFLDIEDILKKTELDNQDRNLLIKFITLHGLRIRPTISSMKKEIFRIIGFESSNPHGTLSTKEVEAIFNFVKSIERTKDDKVPKVKEANGGKPRVGNGKDIR